jgi:hypothetical protein
VGRPGLEPGTYGLKEREREGADHGDSEKRLDRETGSPEIERAEGLAAHSRPNGRAVELEAAIENLTRLLARTDDPEIAAELVAERRTMRGELQALLQPSNVTPIRRA